MEMRVTYTLNRIEVLGHIWQPGIGPCATSRDLSAYDVENAKDEDGRLTRESVQRWIDLNMGDFSEVIDFSADFGDNEFVSDWEDQEHGYEFVSAMYGEDY